MLHCCDKNLQAVCTQRRHKDWHLKCVRKWKGGDQVWITRSHWGMWRCGGDSAAPPTCVLLDFRFIVLVAERWDNNKDMKQQERNRTTWNQRGIWWLGERRTGGITAHTHRGRKVGGRKRHAHTIHSINAKQTVALWPMAADFQVIIIIIWPRRKYVASLINAGWLLVCLKVGQVCGKTNDLWFGCSIH